MASIWAFRVALHNHFKRSIGVSVGDSNYSRSLRLLASALVCNLVRSQAPASAKPIPAKRTDNHDRERRRAPHGQEDETDER
jgi:hypothetical protein